MCASCTAGLTMNINIYKQFQWDFIKKRNDFDACSMNSMHICAAQFVESAIEVAPHS